MNRKITRNFLAIFTAVLMLCSSTVAFATESPSNETATAAVTQDAMQNVAPGATPYATTYASGSGSFMVSNGVVACSKNMGSGTYTVTYNVSRPCTLTMWVDDYTSYDVCTLSGSGSTTISVPLFRTYRAWQLWSADLSYTGNITYSISISK